MKYKVVILYYKLRGRIKKAFEFYEMWKKWVNLFDAIVDEKMKEAGYGK
jgi:hypothetical protein